MNLEIVSSNKTGYNKPTHEQVYEISREPAHEQVREQVRESNDEFKNESKNCEVKKIKISIFTKMSNSVAKRPRVHLALIILLFLIIIILLIYYRGLLYIGPFCQNNMKNGEKKNKLENDSKNEDLLTNELINSINK